MALSDASMQYWFFANGRRFIIMCLVGNVFYTNCYGGFILPYSPSVAALEYTYPLCVGASMGQNGLRFSNTNEGDHRCFWDPANQTNNANGSLGLYTPGNAWLEFINVNAGGTKDSTIAVQTNVGQTLPYHDTSNGDIAAIQVENLQPLLGGDVLLTQVQLARASQTAADRDLYGAFDGVAHVTGVGQSAQNTITIGADTWIVFPQVNRSGNEDYVAIKQ